MLKYLHFAEISTYIKDIAITEEVITKKDKSFFISYKEFIDFFVGEKVLTKSDLILGANFAYGWMPTILTFKNDNIKNCVQYINDVKNNQHLTNEQLEELKAFVNNSMVGVSKLLHFINPQTYPIWDSRVALCFGIPNHQVNNVEKFKTYKNWCYEMLKEDKESTIHNNITSILQQNQIDCNITPLRALEFCLFKMGKNNNNYNATPQNKKI
jgi:hypothetical protein